MRPRLRPRLLAAAILMLMSVKVLTINHRLGKITFLLPTHSATLEATLPDEKVQVLEGQFYEAHIDKGDKSNTLHIKLPDKNKEFDCKIKRVIFVD